MLLGTTTCVWLESALCHGDSFKIFKLKGPVLGLLKTAIHKCGGSKVGNGTGVGLCRSNPLERGAPVDSVDNHLLF